MARVKPAEDQLDLGLWTKSAGLPKDRQAKKETPSARTLLAVCENPGSTTREIGELVGLDTARDWLTNLERHRYIERSGLGGSYWQPTELGQAWQKNQE